MYQTYIDNVSGVYQKVSSVSRSIMCIKCIDQTYQKVSSVLSVLGVFDVYKMYQTYISNEVFVTFYHFDVCDEFCFCHFRK